MSYRIFRATKPAILFDRVQVVGHQLVVLDLDAESLLEEHHDLEHPGRVDDPALEKRLVV